MEKLAVSLTAYNSITLFSHTTPPLPSDCIDGQTVLANGTERLLPGALEGRLEVCLNNTYSPVCFDLWDDPDARVVCRTLQLGQS